MTLNNAAYYAAVPLLVSRPTTFINEIPVGRDTNRGMELLHSALAP